MKNLWIIGALAVLGATGLILGLSGKDVADAGDFSLSVFNIALYGLGFFLIAWKKKYAKVHVVPEPETADAK